MEGARRRGVASALVDELKRLGRERGCVSMSVLTKEEHTRDGPVWERGWT